MKMTWENIAYDQGGGRWTSPVVGLGGGVCYPSKFVLKCNCDKDKGDIANMNDVQQGFSTTKAIVLTSKIQKEEAREEAVRVG